MNIKATQTHFFIEELNYKTHFPKNMVDPDNREIINQSTKGKLGIHKDFNNCYFEMSTDIETYFEDSEENVPYRNLTLTVTYFYDLELPSEVNIEVETEDLYLQIKESLDKYVLNYCRQNVKELVRQITSIDYQPALSLEDIDLQID